MRHSIAALLTLATACALPAALLAAGVRLDPTVNPSGGPQTERPRFSPDGAHVCFRADAASDDAFELYCAPTNPVAPAMRVSGPLAANTSAQLIAFLPAGDELLYVAPQDAAGIYELYRAPLDASTAPLKLNAPLPTNADVLPTATYYAPQAGRVVYVTADGTTTHLRSVALTGPGSDVALDAGMVASRFALFTPDQQHVVFTASESPTAPTELWRVPIAGGTPVKLNGLMAGSGVDGAPQLSADGLHVVYPAYALDPLKRELYSVPLAGGTVHRISHAEVTSAQHFELSPDGEHVLYLARTDGSCLHSAYVAPVRGENLSLRVATDAHCWTSGPPFNTPPTFAFSTDQRHAMLRVNDWSDPPRLLGGPLDGSAPFAVLHSPAYGLDYIASLDRAISNSGGDLFVVAPDGSAIVPLTSTIPGSAAYADYVHASGVLLAGSYDAGRTDWHALFPDGTHPPLHLTDSSPFGAGKCNGSQDFAANATGNALYLCELEAQPLQIGTRYTARLQRRPLDGSPATTLDSVQYMQSQPDRQFAYFAASPTDADTIAYIANRDGEPGIAGLYLSTPVVFADGFESP